MNAARNPRREARSRLGDGSDGRVLEPSPPASSEPPFFADDPLDGGDVLPVTRGRSRTWTDVCREREDPALWSWCAERWLLGPTSRVLEALPERFEAGRLALHAVAEHVLAPARHRANGKVGLRFTLGGFGTPFFGENRQLHVEGEDLVDSGRRHRLTTLGEAARFARVALGTPTGVYTPTSAPDPGRPVSASGEVVAALADWYGFSSAVLEQLRAESTEEEAPGRVQLWPEHFDLAVDLGVEGRRANYGGSPGDAAHPEPYLYVGPWETRTGAFWNEPWGASLSYAELRAGADAVAFLRRAKDELAGAGDG